MKTLPLPTRYLKDRKRKEQISLTLSSIVSEAIYNIENQTLNGIPIAELEQRLSNNPRLPEGMHGACHVCIPIKYFKTMDECVEHGRQKHASWRH